jgi:hypothetical protein
MGKGGELIYFFNLWISVSQMPQRILRRPWLMRLEWGCVTTALRQSEHDGEAAKRQQSALSYQPWRTDTSEGIKCQKFCKRRPARGRRGRSLLSSRDPQLIFTNRQFPLLNKSSIVHQFTVGVVYLVFPTSDGI